MPRWNWNALWMGLACLALASAVTGCDRRGGGPPPAARVAATPAAPATDEFVLLAATSESWEGQPAALLTFSQKLAAAQTFDELIVITGADGATVSGSWVLDADGKRLRLPYLEADKRFTVRLKSGLAAADGRTLDTEQTHEIYTGPKSPLLGFASQGSVLPAHESRGLPVITVNVPEVDVEFLRVRDGRMARFMREYARNGRRSGWDLNSIPEYAESVYTTRFAITANDNERTLSYLPVRDIDELSAPGLYFAVMRRPGRFSDDYDTAMFFVSDIGLHARVYADELLVHTASLESGRPKPGVTVTLRNEKGEVIGSTETDAQGLGRFDYKLDARHMLVAEFGRDVSFLAFNQPALDLSEFTIAGRPQRAAEIFPWSGRDLYRPGEELRVSALLRDFDGRPLPAQTLYATLRQPDGRAIVQQAIEAGELGYYEFSRTIPTDAPTGRWSVDFATDPRTSSVAHAFRFRVEEFLPERLKLDVESKQARLAPGEALALNISAAYLYGAPAAGNRVTAKLAVATDAHPVAALPDFYFGDALAELPGEPRDVIDARLDDSGRLSQSISVLDSAPTGPVKAVVQASVYETGGRAVSRNLSRTIWPAKALVGVRPQFDLADGAPPSGNAGFEVIRVDADGNLLAADKLAVKVLRERRDYNWTWADGTGWTTTFVSRFETVDERELTFAAGQRGQVSVPVEWGGYRIEITDPTTGLTMRLPFEAGWGSSEQAGDEARPDKVKLTLDRAAYRGGDTVKVTLNPPHAGPALLLLESDRLLWQSTIEARQGTTVNIPLDAAWERHDLYLTALVFRPGNSAERITPNRAIGIAHVPIDRSERRIDVALASPESMRPGRPLEILVDAPALAGKTARVRVTAVDLGVLNITRFAKPDAADWFFARRALGIESRDLYGRVIESLDGERARLRFGGDMALPTLPGARRPNAEIRTVDLAARPVAIGADGKATVRIDVPDFNGTLRIRALVFGEDSYGAGERDTIVRAPLVAEASLPRALAPGDRSQLTLDLHNLSGGQARFALALDTDGPVRLGAFPREFTLADNEKRTLSVPLETAGIYGVGEVRAAITGSGVDITRRFRTVVRPAWPAETRSRVEVLRAAQTLAFAGALTSGLIDASVQARITVGTLPPLPFAASAAALLDYPYGCIEQTTSKAWPLILLDAQTRARLGAEDLALTDPQGRRIPFDDAQRASMLDAAFARIASMQLDNGHFEMWPGSGDAVTYLTPYVADMLLDAKDAGLAVPEIVLARALDRLSEDLLSGGNTHYQYDHYEHLRLAEMAYAGYVLARVNRAPLGTLRALYDNQRASLVAPLPLAHLGAALALMGDTERARKSMDEAFSRKFERPEYLGDYGSELRDLTTMVALAQRHGLGKPAQAARLVDVARELLGGGDTRWTSTQEQLAILRVGKELSASAPRSFAASLAIGGRIEESTGRAVLSRLFGPEEISAGVRVTPSGGFPLFVIQDVSGLPSSYTPTEHEEFRIIRTFHRTDGSAWDGGPLAEGDVLVARIKVESSNNMEDALVIDLAPGGLEVENLNLTDASLWADVNIDGMSLGERASAAHIKYEEYRDDRYVAALKLWGGSPATLFYLVRAVSPGRFFVPPPVIEDMYRPRLRAVGTAVPNAITVGAGPAP